MVVLRAWITIQFIIQTLTTIQDLSARVPYQSSSVQDRRRLII